MQTTLRGGTTKPMGLSNVFNRVRDARRLSELASQIARRCHEALWNHVEQRTVKMSIGEARGYIWAKAAEIVEAEVDELLRQERKLADWARTELLADAKLQVVELVLADALVAKTAWHLIHRLAA